MSAAAQHVASEPPIITANGDHPATGSVATTQANDSDPAAPRMTAPSPLGATDLAVLRSPTCYDAVFWRSVMAKKIKKAPQSSIASQEPNPFAAAYATRLARQVSQELSTPRQPSNPRKKKARSAGK